MVRLAFFRPMLLLACLALGAGVPLVVTGPDDAAIGRQYALLVGVKNYNKDELRNLDYTENDVNDLAAVLKDAGYKRVVVMTQSAAADQRDNSLLPTGLNIRDQLRGLLEDRKPGDSVLVAFSGHGVQPRGEKGSYFCPMDAKLADPKTLIALADVYKSLEESKADARVLLVDACRNDPLAGGDKGVEKVKLESVTRPPAEAPPVGVAALFSCSEGEQSYESARNKHGIFFHLVIEGLKGAAPRNKQGEVTLEYLAGYLKDEAPDAAKDEWGPRARQHPELVGKLSGSGSLATVSRNAPATGVLVDLGSLKAAAPADWKKVEPSSKLRWMQFRVPRAADDVEDAELAIYKGIGGGAAANVARWKAEFIPPPGKAVDDVSKVEEIMIGGVKATYLDVSGAYSPAGFLKPPPRLDYRMLAVHYEGQDDAYDFKLVGPAKTVGAARKAFDEWLRSFK